MELIFVDKNFEVIKAYETIIGRESKYSSHNFLIKDINEVANPEYPVDYIVSPANSYGLMDGGIDEVFSLMFPGIGFEVRASIREKYPKSKLLPVGECISVTINKMRRQKKPCITKMIVCPTMETPQDIRGTDNVYLACKGLFKFLKQQNRKVKVIIPGMGTLTGKLTPEESANQIVRALNEL